MSDRDSWTFMVPVGGLLLMDAVGRQFEVERVTFVHRDRLPRVRTKLGLGATVAEVKKTIPGWDFFESGPAFAVVRESGEPKEVERRCLKIVREELSILALSHLGYSKRKQMGPVVPMGEMVASNISFLAVSSQDRTWFGNLFKRTAPSYQLVLDRRWKNFQDNVFFTNLLKILKEKTEVKDTWRIELRKAAVMIGESIGANDLLKSFVWNCVALETLLTRQQDKVRATLPKRAEALLGWATYWEPEDYEGRIRDVYTKRNRLLHSGERAGITDMDVAFTDHLLVNLLTNLVNHPNLFRSKADVIEFSQKVEAERVLGIKPKVRPKDLRFIRSVQPEF